MYLIAASTMSESTGADPELQAIGPIRGAHKLTELQLVLKALSIEHGITVRDDGYYLLVEPRRAARVLKVLHEYERENADWPPRRAPRERLAYEGSARLPLFYSAILAVFFLVTGPVAGGSHWFDVGVSQSQRIMHGDVWRSVTALTLHADAAHVAGNVVAGSAFLWAASRRLGEGRAAMLTLLGGTLGNLANALHHFKQGLPHASIGASTAVFATVGLLAATQWRANREVRVRSWTMRVAPWVGGLTILGMLGAAEHSDLWAHFYGFVAGVVLGVISARTPADAKTSKRWVQPAYALGALALIGASWGVAFAFPR